MVSLTVQTGSVTHLVSDWYSGITEYVLLDSSVTGDFIIERYFPSILTNAQGCGGADVYPNWLYSATFNQINDDQEVCFLRIIQKKYISWKILLSIHKEK